MNVQERHVQPVAPWKPLYTTTPKELNGWLQGRHASPIFLSLVEDGTLLPSGSLHAPVWGSRLQQMPLTAQGC